MTIRVLIYSPTFAPNVGGLETVVAILGEELTKSGECAVTVVTTTPCDPIEPRRDYRVVRLPSVKTFFTLIREADVVVHMNVALRGIWPLLIVRRPWVVSHHSWYRRPSGEIAWQDRLKRFSLRFASASICPGTAMAADLDVASVEVGNAFQDRVFHAREGISRTNNLVAVGRLVSDKGFDVLLDAMAYLRSKEYLMPHLTLIGDGPERRRLEEKTRSLALDQEVTFTGLLAAEAVAKLLCAHTILVVPSRVEPFGKVALEGIACGCAVVAANVGGLPEAVGSNGLLFPKEDAVTLASILGNLLSCPADRARLVVGGAAHVERHCAAKVARRYLQVIKTVLSDWPGRRRLPLSQL